MIGTLAHLSRWRRVVTALACVGLLSNAMLPAAVSLAVGSAEFGICSAAGAANSHDKGRPGLPVHHCALCVAPVAPLPQPQLDKPLRIELAESGHGRPRTLLLAAFPRLSWVQARAPPSMA